MACVDIEILFVIFLRDLSRSDELRQRNQFSSLSNYFPPPRPVYCGNEPSVTHFFSLKVLKNYIYNQQ